MMEMSDYSYVVLDSRQNNSMQPWLGTQKVQKSTRIFQMSPSPEHSSFHHNIRVANMEKVLQDLKDGVNKTFDCSHLLSLQMLAGESRRADLCGPSLQRVHRNIGARLAEYLINEFGSTMNLVTEKSFSHVQGSPYKALVAAGRNMAILPLMRGGEPMARGVHETFPEAQMIHYTDKVTNLAKSIPPSVWSIIVVDSVINRGDSMRKVLYEVQSMMATSLSSTQIFVLSAVTQSTAATVLPKEFPRVRFVTLRISQNQYTGHGGTDTGNRLFGTISSL